MTISLSDQDNLRDQFNKENSRCLRKRKEPINYAAETSNARTSKSVKRSRTDESKTLNRFPANGSHDVHHAALGDDSVIFTDDDASHLMTSWICAECKEAECITNLDSPLLVCEGPCLRLFHYPCARLPGVPPVDQIWICDDCSSERHKCAVCQEYGKDNLDVYKCDRKTCGLYYHERCLSLFDFVTVRQVLKPKPESKESSPVDEKNHERGESNDQSDVKNYLSNCIGGRGDEEEDSDVNIVSIKFRCPAHFCWTCHGGVPLDPQDSNDVTKAESDEDHPSSMKGQGKNKAKAKAQINLSSYFGKKNGSLVRCMECPNAFHISCIPPKCRFHELALLCHEHADTCKLPLLDFTTSVQGVVEAKVNERIIAASRRGGTGYSTGHLKTQNWVKGQECFNRFVPGLRGDIITQCQTETDRLINTDETFGRSVFSPSFCLPVDFRNEVYSRPPSYMHIHSSRYDPNNKPKRQPPNGETCRCTCSCDDQCLNRLAGFECIGDSSKKCGNAYVNCNVGPKCGNRLLSSRLSAKCKQKRETGKGWGLVTVEFINKGDLVQEYVGQVIDEVEKRRRLEVWSIEHPNDPNFYIMQLEPGWYIDAREMGNLSRFINHSCDPNCQLVSVNVSGYYRIAILALRDLSPGEFLSYDYHFDTRDGDKFVCRCGATKCRGTMKAGARLLGEDESKKKTRKEVWLDAKSRLDKDKKFLKDIQLNEKSRLNLTSAYLPGEDVSISQLVSLGPNPRMVPEIRYGHIFLWRNALSGAKFWSRYHKVVKKR